MRVKIDCAPLLLEVCRGEDGRPQRIIQHRAENAALNMSRRIEEISRRFELKFDRHVRTVYAYQLPAQQFRNRGGFMGFKWGGLHHHLQAIRRRYSTQLT